MIAADQPEGDRRLVRVRIASDGRGFVLGDSQTPMVPWGFNFDRLDDGRLLEDFWESEWPLVESAFAEMKRLGANVVRIHLQTGAFLDSPTRVRESSLKQLRRLIELAERERLYLNLTGLGCYHREAVPAWFDELDEQQRWAAQAVFWRAVAVVGRSSPAVFCYNLMNEPVVPGGDQKRTDWLGGGFGGKHFVQFISLDRGGRPRPEIARGWIATLVDAIREVDTETLVTVGLVDWSLDGPGLTSGFIPDQIAERLDFLAVHLYPERGKVDEALQKLERFAKVGKPVVIEETFPLRCDIDEFADFLVRSRSSASGWFGFYWGVTVEEYREREPSVGRAMMLGWLDLFRTARPPVD
ncbi:MAG: hypothetical protein EA381_01945 [Planctomycetaceae bacterium]|nr:MAG: hypothetical protein EA381_01945 [Planctomycetaceae bacterium]